MAKIHYVDDLKAVRTLAQLILGGEGHDVSASEQMHDSYLDGLDLLIIDIHLVGENGDAIVQRLRNEDKLKGIGVIFTSTDKQALESSKDLADGIICPPVPKEDFVNMVNKILEKYQ